MKNVHDRMPLLLERNEIEDWIYESSFLEFALHRQQPQLRQFRPYIQQSLY